MMKAYMVYSISAGSAEGACLVFASTAKEARKLGAKYIYDWFMTDWVDVGVRWLRDRDLLFGEADQDKLKNNTPHAIENPETCSVCGFWGVSRIENGLCSDCIAEKDN